MRMTSAEYQSWLVRHAPAAEPDSREEYLHGKILDECKRRGWIALHGSTAHRTRRTLGEFDFVILAEGGRLHLIECKRRGEKLSQEQVIMHHVATLLGFQPMVVHSFREFLNFVGINPAIRGA